MIADRCPIERPCVNNPTPLEGESMQSIIQFRNELFSAATQKERMRILFERCVLDNCFSNMSDKERSEFLELKERLAQ